jgi:probable DNA metabolism protein
MARLVNLPSQADFAAWRDHARSLAIAGVPPDDVVWHVADGGQRADLFARSDGSTTGAEAANAEQAPLPVLTVPRDFVALAKDVICHSHPERFALLYQVLWRLRSERHLLQVATDPDVQRLQALAKSVRRDRHKMTAFVRFREISGDHGSTWVAWFEPQHYIVESTAPFFMRRFASMVWSILTPRISAHWNGHELTFGAGATRSDAPAEDAKEDVWRVYFASIFNPARLNTAAMQREMPKKYWKNMPEAELIPDLVRAAASRTHAMLANAPTLSRVAGQIREPSMPRTYAQRIRAAITAPGDAPATLSEFNAQLAACRLCPLWRHATQAVPGVGKSSAQIMLVGEQPGDQEDLAGLPFVGPAGKVLDGALEAADLPRAALYVTNAVKHFKFEPRGKRRLHKKPNAGEIDTCRWWLAHEIGLVKPKLIVALGATAAASILQRPVKISAERGRPLTLSDGSHVLVTVHPSYLLRLPDEAVAARERQLFVEDLRQARRIASDLGAELNAA